MNLKRAVGAGAMQWLISFVAYIPIEAVPALKNNLLYGYIYFWIIMIPVTLLVAKWYFKKVMPTAKSGLILGLTMIATSFALDVVTMLPLLAQSVEAYKEQCQSLYGNWMFWVVVVEVIVIATYAGWEFDGTETPAPAKPEEKK